MAADQEGPACGECASQEEHDRRMDRMRRILDDEGLQLRGGRLERVEDERPAD